MTLGDLIRNKRRLLNLTQAELEEKSGVNQNYISKIENGHVKKPQKTTIIKLTKALDISDNEIQLIKK